MNRWTVLALLSIPGSTPGVTPSWEYIKLCLTIIFQAMGYTTNFMC